MTRHLNANGSLTHRQRERANELEINHMDYRLKVLQELNDYHEEIIQRNNKPVTIECEKPCIIIGHGDDWEKQAEKIKDTAMPVVSTDACAIPLIQMGIIPRYIVTFEESPKVVKDSLFPYKDIKKHDIKVYGSKLTRTWLRDSLHKAGTKFRRWTDYGFCSHVGLFGALFARDYLKADKCIMIGMNCWKNDIDFSKNNWEIPRLRYPFLDWYTHWRQFVLDSPEGFIVNCTQGGLLYFGGIIRADYAKLVIECPR